MYPCNLRHCQTTRRTLVTAVGLSLLVGMSSLAFAHTEAPPSPSGALGSESPRPTSPSHNLTHSGGRADSSVAAPLESHPPALTVEVPGDLQASAGVTTHDHSAHDHSAHDHSAHGTWADSEIEVFLAWLGRFHPALTNFPIALLLLAALAELACCASRRARPRLQQNARFCAQWGAATALLATIAGWFYGGFAIGGDDPVMAAHRWNGTLIGVLAPLLWWLAGGETRRRSYQLLLFLLALLVAGNGYLGGRLLYGADHYDYPRLHSDHAHGPEGH